MGKWAGRTLMTAFILSLMGNSFQYAWILHLNQIINIILTLQSH